MKKNAPLISKRKKNIPWPAENAQPMTRDALSRQWKSCQTRQVIQYYGTCWIASLVFVVYNNKTLRQLMSQRVRNYVLSYFRDPGAATSLYNLYELRNEEETTDQCRGIPKEISELYLRFAEGTSKGYKGYISSAAGGHADLLFDAFCVASDLRLAVIVVNTKLIWPLKEEFDHLADIVRVECWCPPVPLFSSKLTQLCDMAINLLYGFECVGGLVSVTKKEEPPHIMGFVRCQNGLATGYDDDFFLSQTYHFSSGSRVSQLVHARPGADFKFDSQKTRTTTDDIYSVTFLYTRSPGMSGNAHEVNHTYTRIHQLQHHLKHV